MSEKYSVLDYTLDRILNFIKSNEIAIPEIQDSFVWNGKQVHVLVNSLYKGYSTGLQQQEIVCTLDTVLKKIPCQRSYPKSLGPNRLAKKINLSPSV